MGNCCFWRECKREFKQVTSEPNPGYILKTLRYIFKFFYLCSFSKWISGTSKHEEMRGQGNLRPYLAIDIYVTVWVMIELATIGILHLPAISRESIASYVIIGFLSYRLFDIFQSWVYQFVLKSRWEAIDVNRSLVLIFVGYAEITIIGAIIRFICQQSNNFSDAFYNSVMTMIANPQKEVSAIQYTQIMFAILFVTAVVQHVVGRLSTK